MSDLNILNSEKLTAFWKIHYVSLPSLTPREDESGRLRKQLNYNDETKIIITRLSKEIFRPTNQKTFTAGYSPRTNVRRTPLLKCIYRYGYKPMENHLSSERCTSSNNAVIIIYTEKKYGIYTSRW